MIVTLFLIVKLQHTGAPKTLVATHGERIRDMGGKTVHCKTNEGIRRSIKHKSASVVKPLISMRKVVQAGGVETLQMARQSSWLRTMVSTR